MKRWLTILMALAMMVISGCGGSGPNELTLSFGRGLHETDRLFGVELPDSYSTMFGISVTWYLNPPQSGRRLGGGPGRQSNAGDVKRVKDGQDESDGS